MLVNRRYRYVGAVADYAAWLAESTVNDPIVSGDLRILTDNDELVVQEYQGTDWKTIFVNGARPVVSQATTSTWANFVAVTDAYTAGTHIDERWSISDPDNIPAPNTGIIRWCWDGQTRKKDLQDVDGSARTLDTGLPGTATSSAFWADSVYADADKWISSTGCDYFSVTSWDTLATADHGLVIAWSTTYDDDLSSVIAAAASGTASVLKTAKEATLTEHSGIGFLKWDTQEFQVVSNTPIKTIRICAVTSDKACVLKTGTFV